MYFVPTGKDITQKLYSLNEHLSGLEDDRQRGRRDELWARTHSRSMSMDAVNTGTTGLVRSITYKNSQRNLSLTSAQSKPIILNYRVKAPKFSRFQFSVTFRKRIH